MGPRGQNRSAVQPATQAEEMPPVQEPSEGETPDPAADTENGEATQVADTQVQPEAQASPEPAQAETEEPTDVLTQVLSLLTAQTQLLLNLGNRLDSLEAKIDALRTKGVAAPAQGKSSDGVPLVDGNGKCPVCSTVTHRKDRKCGSCYVNAMKAEMQSAQPANAA